jgi:hypothetical protein
MKRFLILALVFSLFLVFNSCQKKKEDKILGNWKYVYLQNIGNKEQTWYFTDNKKFIITIQDSIIYNDTAEWSLSTNLLSPATFKIINLKKINGESINGTYEVLTLNKKYFIIQRTILENGSTKGAFNRMEFVKSN